MKNPVIEKQTLKFLSELALNNNRDWFNKNKQLYLDAHQNLISFIDALIVEINKHDVLENKSGKKSLYRIYNDVRFSKNKAPYNPRFAFGFQREGKLRRGGYYFNLKPGSSFLACGFFAPNPADLKRIREDIDCNFDDWKRILHLKNIKANFGKLTGNQVATAPRGFKTDNPSIELLRHKQFIFRHQFSDKEVLSEGFLPEVNRIFKSVRTYFDYMSEVLTTDANGELVV